ncbi:response regulator [Methylobacterium segetis]|uniref:response regulator n=1 Tax=Methylobacterium segetis TaxID=2488750 RepID=UPI001052708A|nr:response regulator [Methylobacterium segetis]
MPQETGQEESGEPETGHLKGRVVLLVEDDYFLASDLQRHFAASGAEIVGPVPSVTEALTLIAATPALDAAVLDINLRGEMAFPVADALIARGVPFLFATGYSAGTLPPRYGGLRHCEKPIEPQQIAELLCASGLADPAPHPTSPAA